MWWGADAEICRYGMGAKCSCVCVCVLLKWTASSFLLFWYWKRLLRLFVCVWLLTDLYIIRIKFNGWCMRFSLHQCRLFDNCYRSADKWNFSRLCAICVYIGIHKSDEHVFRCVGVYTCDRAHSILSCLISCFNCSVILNTWEWDALAIQ